LCKRLVAVTLVLLFTLVTPAVAITNGQLDGTKHPYVGMVVFYDETGTFIWRCSGTLVSPTIFLTAAHCIAPDPLYGTPVNAQVWFDPIPSDVGYPYSGGILGSHLYMMPGYRSVPLAGLPGFDYHDVGVIVLDEPVSTIDPATLPKLPTQGLVDTLPMKTGVTVVGYGSQYKLQTSGPPGNRWRGNTRMFAPAQIIQSNDVIAYEYVKLTENPGQGKGGTCFGDSGGPVLYKNARGDIIILAVTSFGSNANCAGVGYYNRIDTADALAFISNPS
jgi:secreted trypsin-like serine protease